MSQKVQQFGSRIRAFRMAQKLTQGELGKRVGLDQGQISRLEHGAYEGTSAQILAIAKALGVTVSDIMGDKAAEPRTNGYHVPQGPDPRASILVDYGAPPGLRDLASDTSLIDALQITPEEWRRLAAVPLPQQVDKEGYMQLLITLRAICR